MRALTPIDENQPGHWTPSTEEDRRAVREQLDRMLDNPLFRNSKRYPNLLRHLVEETLAGNEAELKERLLGVIVFHRSPDYDTNQDTVVRLTAGEVRKRIAQYYHQPGHAGQLQIDLVAGSYVPVFRRPDAQAQNGSAPHLEIADESVKSENSGTAPAQPETFGTTWAEPVEIPLAPEKALVASTPVLPKLLASRPQVPFLRLAARWTAAGLVLLAAVAGALFGGNVNRAAHRADRQLWAPILEEPGQIHLVVADLSATVSQTEARETSQTGGLFDVLRMGEMVNYRDSLAQTGIVAFLARNNKSYSLELSTQATYPELQKSASVLIGGLDNVWTMRVTGPLRYHFVQRGGSYSFGIVDRQHSEQGWYEDLSQPTERITEDYALVARIFDQTTGRPVLVVAGLGANGTAAAAQFLLDPERMAELTAHAPRDWQRLNMEAVLRTQILDNHAGPPRLVACTFW